MGGARTRAADNTGGAGRIGRAKKTTSAMTGPRTIAGAAASEPGEWNAS